MRCRRYGQPLMHEEHAGASMAHCEGLLRLLCKGLRGRRFQDMSIPSPSPTSQPAPRWCSCHIVSGGGSSSSNKPDLLALEQHSQKPLDRLAMPLLVPHKPTTLPTSRELQILPTAAEALEVFLVVEAQVRLMDADTSV